MVTGYDSDPASATFGTFRFKNPWGFYDPAAPLTWDDLCSFCPWLAVAAYLADSIAAGGDFSSLENTQTRRAHAADVFFALMGAQDA